ncbi:nitroreductase [Clostridium sporogenes]
MVDYKNLLNKAIKLTIEELVSNSFIMIRFHHYIQSYHNKGIDTVLRGSPCLMLATADVNLIYFMKPFF